MFYPEEATSLSGVALSLYIDVYLMVKPYFVLLGYITLSCIQNNAFSSTQFKIPFTLGVTFFPLPEPSSTILGKLTLDNTLPKTAEMRERPVTTHKEPNRLINEKSPYLLQHAHNPVDWYLWGVKAFAKARRQKIS